VGRDAAASRDIAERSFLRALTREKALRVGSCVNSSARPDAAHTCHFEIKCIQNGRATLLRDCEDTLNHAREAAAYKAKVLGFENLFELEAGENFSDMTQDGVYLTTVRTETLSQPL
jgi:hypothetical protein